MASVTGYTKSKVDDLLSGRVPTDRSVNNKPLSADIELSAADVGAVATTTKGVANGVATLDDSGLIPDSQLPVKHVNITYEDWLELSEYAPNTYYHFVPAEEE